VPSVAADDVAARLDEAAHRFLHRDPGSCVTPERAEEIAAAGGYPGAICVWGLFGDGGERLRAALAEAGLAVSAAP